MKMRLDVPIVLGNSVSLVAKPSYDKPGEQVLYISIKQDNGLNIDMFLYKEEAFEFQKQINEAIEDIEWN